MSSAPYIMPNCFTVAKASRWVPKLKGEDLASPLCLRGVAEPQTDRASKVAGGSSRVTCRAGHGRASHDLLPAIPKS